MPKFTDSMNSVISVEPYVSINITHALFMQNLTGKKCQNYRKNEISYIWFVHISGNTTCNYLPQNISVEIRHY